MKAAGERLMAGWSGGVRGVGGRKGCVARTWRERKKKGVFDRRWLRMGDGADAVSTQFAERTMCVPRGASIPMHAMRYQNGFPPIRKSIFPVQAECEIRTRDLTLTKGAL